MRHRLATVPTAASAILLSVSLALLVGLASGPAAALAKPTGALAKSSAAPAKTAAAGHSRKAAAAARRDAAATRTYVKANYTLVRAARATLVTAKTAIDGLAATVAGECPLIAREAPQNHDAEQLSNEVVGALEVAAYQPDTASMITLAHAIRGLRWSNPKLTRMVHTYAVKLEGFPTLPPPSICADVSAWVSSGYQTLTPGTIAFDKGFEAFSLEAEEVSLRLLRPYESATEASLLRLTKKLESPLAEFEAEAVSDYSEILNSLKLPQ